MAWVLISDHPDVESRSFLYRPSPNPAMSLEETSEQVIDQLMESLQAIEKELLPYQLEAKRMVITQEQKAEFQAAKECYMCDDNKLSKWIYKDSKRLTLCWNQSKPKGLLVQSTGLITRFSKTRR